MNVSRWRSPICSHVDVGQRLGGDHERVERDQRPPLAARLGVKPSVARTTTSAAHGAVVGDAPGRGSMAVTRVPSWIVAPRRSTASRQAAGEPGRVDGRAVRRVQRAEHAARRRGARRPRRGRASAGRPRRSRTGGPRRARPGSRTVWAGLVARCEVAALGEVAVDALRRGGPHRPRRRSSNIARCMASAASWPGMRRHGREAHGEQRRAPAAVAAAGAEAGDLGLEDDDPQTGIQPEQVVGGPQARCSPPPTMATSTSRVAIEGRPRFERVVGRERVVPEGERAEVRHRGERRGAPGAPPGAGGPADGERPVASAPCGPLLRSVAPRRRPPCGRRRGTRTPGKAPERVRWWDGREWTVHTAHPAGRGPPRAVPHPARRWPRGGAWSSRWRRWSATRVGARAARPLRLADRRVRRAGGLLGYGPMVAYCSFASRRWGTGQLRHRPRAARALVRPRLGPGHLAVGMGAAASWRPSSCCRSTPITSNTEGHRRPRGRPGRADRLPDRRRASWRRWSRR